MRPQTREFGISDLRYLCTRNGMRYFRGNGLAANRSELYGYDRLDRLTSLQRGTVNGQNLVPGTRNFAQRWTLDGADNWSQFGEAPLGNNQWNQQQRTHNFVN